jgi:hypothetical protein
MALPPIIQSIVDWLRRGYPHGVPQQDYVPLLAILGRHLSPEEAADVVGALLVNNPHKLTPSADAVKAAIEEVTSSPALDSDVQRVSQHLANVRAAEAQVGGS